jgi:hypothetical protein
MCIFYLIFFLQILSKCQNFTFDPAVILKANKYFTHVISWISLSILGSNFKLIYMYLGILTIPYKLFMQTIHVNFLYKNLIGLTSSPTYLIPAYEIKVWHFKLKFK